MHTHRLVQPVGLLFLLATFAFSGAFASAASAAVPGLQRVTAVSPSDSLTRKQVTVQCPVGKRVLGAGGDITGGAGQVVMDGVSPGLVLGSVIVSGVEDDNGTTANWSLRAHAICADPLPGLELVTARSASDSLSDKSVTATCPLGKQLVGTGGDIPGAGRNGQVVMDDLTPNAALTAVRLTGFEDEDGTTDTWTLRAYAICANPLAGHQLVTGFSQNNLLSPKSASATCPFPKQLTGLGGDITGGLGQVVMNTLTPNTSLTSTTLTGFQDDTGTTTDWQLRAHAICASP